MAIDKKRADILVVLQDAGDWHLDAVVGFFPTLWYVINMRLDARGTLCQRSICMAKGQRPSTREGL